MARPRRQTYTMKQYLDNESEGYISNDADTQRNPAWKPIIDGLAVTILTDDYVPAIILAEEDIGQIHIVDGGSRTAAFKMLRYGNYKIKSSVDNPIIKYNQKTKDENGKTVWKKAEFDIRNKTFEQFPKELQKNFDEYQIDTVIHEHCDKDKIAMYIKRYNEHKAMNANEKMFVHLPKFAEKIRAICNRSFFINNTEIKDIEKEKGILERILSESVMCMFHLEKWNKNGKKLATYLNQNANEREFDKLNENIAKLENIITEHTKVLFSSKDTFIWLTLFDKFTQLELPDIEFGKFLEAFVNGLRNKPINGKLFDNVDEIGSTKDKAVIIEKLHILETLMKEYLHIDEPKDILDDEKFISNIVEIDKTEVHENMGLYKDTLDGDYGLKEKCIKCDSKLLDVQNSLSLLALVAYSYKIGQDLDNWLVEYAKNNNTYFMDQKRNYYHMRREFDEYLRREAVA